MPDRTYVKAEQTETVRFDGKSGPGIVSTDLDALMRSRMLVQANSGGGKSHLLRSLLEQTHGRVQAIVLDPEGEFGSLREHFPFVLAGKEGDVPAHPKVARVLARRLLQARASAVIDLYDLTLSERREFVRLFLTELMALPKALWTPTLVVLDEAHLFCPERGSGEAQSTEAVIALCTQGRKRQYCAVLATQRISKLHKDAAAELLNKLIGRTGLDVDMKRAGDELGMDREGRAGLRDLVPGEFFAFGPALGGRVRKVRSGSVQSRGPEAGNAAAATPPAHASVRALVEKIGDLPALAKADEDRVAMLERTVKELLAKLRAKPGLTDEEREQLIANVRAEAERRAIQHMTDVLQSVRDTVVAAINGRVASLGERPRTESKSIALTAPTIVTSPARGVPVAVARSTPAAEQPSVRESNLSQPQQRMLNVLAKCEAMGLTTPSYAHVAVWSGQSPRSSGYEKNLSTLSAAGFVQRRPGRLLALTEKGRDFAAVVRTPPTLEDLHEAWMPFLSGPQQRMVRQLIACFPEATAYIDLAAATDQSPKSSGFEKNLSTLSALGLAERRAGRMIAAGALLFPEVR
jgi:hypothetical protein